MVRIRQPKPRQTLIAPLLAALLLTACHTPASRKLFDPAQINFTAACNPLYDNQLYPSLILATNQVTSNNFNSQYPIFDVTLTAPADNSVLRIVIDSSAFNYVTIFQEILPRRGEQYTFAPSVKWKYDILRAQRTPRNLDLTFTCYINDEEVDIKNLHLTCRTVNECPLSLAADNQMVDLRWLFAAYVNEDHPQIEQILTDILDQGTVNRLAGYQSNRMGDVADQVFAVWYYALDHGITYSSITCTSNPSPRANVQHIRFFDEVYNSRQANCVDACVFFASILRKLGLKPVIFVEPCHAYLGYYTDRNRRNIALLETTITSWVNFPDLERSLDDDGRLPDDKFQKISKYLSEKEVENYQEGKMTFQQLKLAVARSLFQKATEYDRETYDANREHFADPNAITYQQLDIELLRKQVQPIN